jgi:hypothetical protein
MIDGHVEFILPLQSEGRNDLLEQHSDKTYPDIWTVEH